MDKKPMIFVISPRDDERYEQMMEDRVANYEPEYREEADNELD